MTGRKSSRRAANSAERETDPGLIDRLRRATGAYTLRTGQSITFKELGEFVNLTPSSMTDVLTLKRKVTIREACIWADKLGVQFSWLAIGRGPMVVMTQEDATRFGVPPAAGEPASDLFRKRDQARQTRDGRTGS